MLKVIFLVFFLSCQARADIITNSIFNVHHHVKNDKSLLIYKEFLEQLSSNKIDKRFYIFMAYKLSGKSWEDIKKLYRFKFYKVFEYPKPSIIAKKLNIKVYPNDLVKMKSFDEFKDDFYYIFITLRYYDNNNVREFFKLIKRDNDIKNYLKNRIILDFGVEYTYKFEERAKSKGMKVYVPDKISYSRDIISMSLEDAINYCQKYGKEFFNHFHRLNLRGKFEDEFSDIDYKFLKCTL